MGTDRVRSNRRSRSAGSQRPAQPSLGSKNFEHKNIRQRAGLSPTRWRDGQMLWSTATIRTFFASNTRDQFAAVENSAFVGLTPARLELVNFTPRGCRM